MSYFSSAGPKQVKVPTMTTLKGNCSIDFAPYRGKTLKSPLKVTLVDQLSSHCGVYASCLPLQHKHVSGNRQWCLRDPRLQATKYKDKGGQTDDKVWLDVGRCPTFAERCCGPATCYSYLVLVKINFLEKS